MKTSFIRFSFFYRHVSLSLNDASVQRGLSTAQSLDYIRHYAKYMSTVELPTTMEFATGQLVRDLVVPVTNKMVANRRNIALTTAAIGGVLFVALVYQFFKLFTDIVGECQSYLDNELALLQRAHGTNLDTPQYLDLQMRGLKYCKDSLTAQGFDIGDASQSGRIGFGSFEPFLKHAYTKYPWISVGFIVYGIAATYAFWASKSVQMIGDDLKKFELATESKKRGTYWRTMQSDYYAAAPFRKAATAPTDPTAFIELALDIKNCKQQYIKDVADLSQLERIGSLQKSAINVAQTRPSNDVPMAKKPKVKTRGVPGIPSGQKPAGAVKELSPLAEHVALFLKHNSPCSEEIRHVVVVNSALVLFIAIPRKDWITAYPDSVQQREAEQAIQKGLVRRRYGQAGLKYIDRKMGVELKTLGAAAGQTRALVGMFSPTLTRVEASDIRIAHLTLRYSSHAARTLHKG